MYAVNAARNADKLQKTAERTSSGQRLNRASDDAAGLGIAEGLRAQVRGSQQAARNIQDGINIVRIGIDGTEGVFPVLHRLRELVVQAANGSYSRDETKAIQQEIDEVKRLIPESFEIAQQSRIAFDGNPFDRSLDIQVGADAGETIRIDYNPLRDKLLKAVIGSFGYKELYESEFQGMAGSVTFPSAPPAPNPLIEAAFPKKLVVDPNTEENISTALTFIDQTMTDITAEVAYLGAKHNQLEHTLNEVTNYTVQAGDSESRIRDADMAATATEMVKQQITSQASISIVSQGNMRPVLVMEMVQKLSDEAQQRAPGG
jgi:flagellin